MALASSVACSVAFGSRETIQGKGVTKIVTRLSEVAVKCITQVFATR